MSSGVLSVPRDNGCYRFAASSAYSPATRFLASPCLPHGCAYRPLADSLIASGLDSLCGRHVSISKIRFTDPHTVHDDRQLPGHGGGGRLEAVALCQPDTP